MEDSGLNNIPLCVDLDGTITKTDTLAEALIIAVKNKPYLVFLLPFWLLGGREYFKEKVISHALPDTDLIPYNSEFNEFLQNEFKSGRQIYLVTASMQKTADLFKEKLGIFVDAYGSTRNYHLKGTKKRDFLVEKFGEKGYDYAGDSKADLPVWASARHAIVVNSSDSTKAKASKISNVQKYFPRKNHNTIALVIKEIRVHQWMKNLLIFLPLLMAHKLSDTSSFVNTVLAFLSFCFSASFVYVVNDMLDINSDRKHPRKKFRPIASGNLPFHKAAFIAGILILAGIFLAVFFLPLNFMIILFIYLFLTTSYTFYLKRIVILDIFVLSILYTIRIVAGGMAADVLISKWLLAFSVFIFLSLAIVKRYTELKVMLSENKTETSGRGYFTDDINLLLGIGPATGFLSVLVFALYISSPEVKGLYVHPELLWPVTLCLLFWITRIWFLAHRGKMHDDPIVFTGKDMISYFIGLIIAILIIGAAL